MKECVGIEHFIGEKFEVKLKMRKIICEIELVLGKIEANGNKINKTIIAYCRNTSRNKKCGPENKEKWKKSRILKRKW